MKRLRSSNIKRRLVRTMIIYSVAIAIAIGGIGLYSHYKLYKSNVLDKLNMLPQVYSNQFNSDFRSVENLVNYLGKYVEANFQIKTFNKNKEKYLNLYQNALDKQVFELAGIINKNDGVKTLNGITGVYMTINPFLSGKVHEVWYADTLGKGNLIKVDSNADGNYFKRFSKDNPEMNWYFAPIQKKQGTWIEPYIDKDINEAIVSYTKPIYKDGILLGVAGIDISLENLSKTIRNIKLYKTGYSFIMNSNYHFILHKKYTFKDSLTTIGNGQLAYLKPELEAKSTGVLRYELDKEKKIFAYTHLTNGWILSFAIKEYEVYEALLAQIIIISLVVILFTILVTFIAIRIAESISKPIASVTELIKNTSHFDFSRDANSEAMPETSDEIVNMIKETNRMRRVLQETGVHRAAEWQREILPKYFPIENKAKLEYIYAPSKTVSGDYYQLEPIDEELMVGILWDVSGKGVTAGINSLAFNVLFHEELLKHREPIEIINNLNRKVGEHIKENYIAACCFSMDFKAGILKVVGAGINQFLYKPADGRINQEVVPGPFLGMFAESEFSQVVLELNKGCKCYFYTDGLDFIFEEAENRDLVSEIGDNKEVIKYIEGMMAKQIAKENVSMDDCTFFMIDII